MIWPMKPPRFSRSAFFIMRRFASPFASLLLLGLPLHATGNEPTNAKEAEAQKKAAAEQKAAEQKVLNEKFAAWKATLPPEQQAWETVLEQNLGMGFYLPLYQKDKLAGRVTAWDYVKDDPKLPRVLLIGDSISRGYTLATRKALTGMANLHRAPENCGPTANALKKLPVWLGEGKWDIIHFNFGIHDRKTPLADYEQRLDSLASQLKATGAKIIWASTTPVAEGGMKDATDADLVARNEVAAKIMQKHSIAVDDLYTWIKPDLAQYQNPKDVHFSNAGYDRLAEQVASSIAKVVPTLTSVNTAIIPTGKIEKDGYEWADRHAAVMKIKDEVNPEIVLIGDSITHFWGGLPDGAPKGNRGTQAWKELFGQRRVLNLGFGWDRTQNVLKRIQLGELDGLHPKAIVIHIGTNNTSKTPNARDSSPTEIAQGVGLIIDQAQAKCPGAKIILMGIFPRGKAATDPKRALLAEINRQLAPLGKKPGVTYLDTTSQWLEADGTLSKEVMPDGVHPSEKGYAIWAAALKGVLPK